MRLLKVASLTLAIAALTMAQASAGPIVVSTDSGSIGGIELENMGISGGTATIEIHSLPNLFSQINTVNGASLATPEPISINGPVTMLVTLTTPQNYSISLVPSTYDKTVGNVTGAEAQMAFNITTGVAPSVLPDFFNMSGKVTSLLENDNPRFDYRFFGNGGDINFTFTGTTFTGGISSFAGLFSTAGSTITANGSFSQSAVPEPASVTLLSFGVVPIGIAAVLARIKRKRKGQ